MENAERFYKELVQSTSGIPKESYGDNSIWTAQMRLLITQVIKKIKPDADISYEYYRIDSIGWIQRKDEIRAHCEAVDMKPHLWDLGVAVEYENNGDDWLDEVCKLSYIRCPLRVVISYGMENAEDKIKLAKTVLDETNAFTDDKQEFLIILGRHAKEYKEDQANPCGFQGWVITKSGYTRISENENHA